MATFTGCRTTFGVILKHVIASLPPEFMEAMDKIGRTALMYACSLDYSDIATVLIDLYDVRVDQWITWAIARWHLPSPLD